MISQDSRHTDKDDVAVLFRAMVHFEAANADDIDTTMASIGFAELLTRAEVAAEVIAECHEAEGANWDNAMWLDRLENIEDGSLAAELYQLDSDHSAHVVVAVKDWLDTQGL